MPLLLTADKCLHVQIKLGLQHLPIFDSIKTYGLNCIYRVPQRCIRPLSNAGASHRQVCFDGKISP